MTFKSLINGFIPRIEEPAETTGGELLKAALLIWKRFEAVGDTICGPNGGEFVNKAARFIKERYPDTDMAATVDALWGLENIETYKAGAIRLTEQTAKYITDNPELLSQENEWDLLEFDGPEDLEGLEDEEDWDEWGGKSQREIDLAEYPPLDWRR